MRLDFKKEYVIRQFEKSKIRVTIVIEAVTDAHNNLRDETEVLYNF